MFKVNQICKIAKGPKQIIFGKEIFRDSEDIGKIVMIESVKDRDDGSHIYSVLYAEPSESGKLAWFTNDELEYIGDADNEVINTIKELNVEYNNKDMTIEYCRENINGRLTRRSMEFLYSKIGFRSKYSQSQDVLDIGLDQYIWGTSLKAVFEAIFDKDLKRALTAYDEFSRPHHNKIITNNIIKFYNELYLEEVNNEQETEKEDGKENIPKRN